MEPWYQVPRESHSLTIFYLTQFLLDKYKFTNSQKQKNKKSTPISLQQIPKNNTCLILLIKVAICHLIPAYNSSSRVWQGLIRDNRNWKWMPRVATCGYPMDEI